MTSVNSDNSTEKPTQNPKKPELEKKPVGRPTKYNPKICETMINYFETELFEVKKKKVMTKFGPVEQEYLVACRLPTFERFSVDQKLADSTIRLWKEKHTEFSAAYRACKKIQKEILMYHGLAGNYNATFAKFVAINCTDMIDGVAPQQDGPIQIIIQKEDEELC